MKSNVYKARVGLILPALNRVADRSEGIFLLALQVWMDFAHKQIRRDLTERYIKKDVTTKLTDWEFIEEQGNEILKPATLRIMQRGGGQAYRILQAQVSFDVLNPEAVKAAGKLTAKLVREVTQKTKEGIRSHIKAGVKAGKSMDKIARGLKPLVGLTQRQVEAISRYRQLLEEKRPDLSSAQLDKRINTLINKTHRRRMKTIARTETARAQSVGYAIGLQDLGIDEVEFQIHPDDKTCDECSGLNETKFKVEEGGGIIPVHPNCRCVLLPVIADTPTCRMAKRLEKATCNPPDDLHDKQIEDLLKKLKVAPPAEGRKIRSALRRLGHKGGLGGKPPITTPPTVKPTKPVVPKPRGLKPVTEGSGSDIGYVGRLKELSPEFSSGKTGADALTFVKDGKKYFAKRMRGDEILQFQREATAARAMEKVGLGKYTPRVHIAEGTYEGKKIRVIASEMIEKHRDLSTLELSQKYRILNTVGDEVKERLILQDYLMGAWDRSASNMMVKKGSIKMIDYELAFSQKAPVWSDHTLMQFLGKKIKAPAPDGKSFMLRVHEGSPSRYKFSQTILQDTIDSAKNVKIAIDEMNIPANVKLLWKAGVDERAKELTRMIGVIPKPAVPKLFEATNIGKAESNARRILGISRFDPKARKAISFGKIDVEAANHINRGLYNFKQKFPQLKLDGIQIGGKGKNIYAEVNMKAHTGKATLILDGDEFKSYKSLARTLKRNGKTNYLVGDSIEDLMAHEMGHVLNFKHLWARHGKDRVRMEMDRLATIRFSQKGLSKYATQDGAEGLAEIFSKYMKTDSFGGIRTAAGSPRPAAVELASIKRILKTYAGVEL